MDSIGLKVLRLGFSDDFESPLRWAEKFFPMVSIRDSPLTYALRNENSVMWDSRLGYPKAGKMSALNIWMLFDPHSLAISI
jgi:hypothetical protein